MEKKQAHLQMIQGVVNRLSTNSFLLKGWTVILVSAMFALSAGEHDRDFILLAYFPGIAFWILDGFFLWQERLYRALYDYVRGLPDDEIDFSMNTSVIRNRVNPWIDVVFSMTLVIFHGVVVVSILLVMFLSGNAFGGKQ